MKCVNFILGVSGEAFSFRITLILLCQNKMVRFMCGFSPRQSVNYNELNSLNMLNVEDRVKQLRLNHVFNIFNENAPSYLRDNFVIRRSNSGRQTRSYTNLNFIVSRVKTCQSSTFYFNAIKDWNKLPLKRVFQSKTVIFTLSCAYCVSAICKYN